MSSPFDLEFLRPAWLLALLLLPLLAWAWHRRARRRSAWNAAVDPHLLVHLLGAGGGRRGGSLAAWAVLSGLALAVVAAAGPSWRSVPQPLQGGGGALVIALDLSSATLTGDLPPSRLAQARSRLDALLHAHAGEVGLVAYADDAFVVAPVTPDPANVAVFLDALAPDIMPVDGQRPERAIALAADLLERSGHGRGDILLIAPEAGHAAVRAAARAAASGYRVSALAMGTVEGAGYRGRDGEIHRSALDPVSLQALAAAGGGRLHAWDAPPAEVVASAGGSDGDGGRSREAAGQGLVREDGGYWLLPLALLLLLFVFRRGGTLAMVALCVLLPLQPSLAADTGPEAGAWRRADQAAHARSVEAEAAYRAGEFEAAARGWAALPGAEAAYNRGNALALAGRYEEAIAAYDKALEAAPDMSDALANRAAVEAAMRRSPPPPGGGEHGGTPPQGKQRADASDDADSDEASPPPPPADADPHVAARQQAADQAQREAMQRALEADAGTSANTEPAEGAVPEQSGRETEREQANAAWLRRVPDDPGALLRARFRNEHLRRRTEER